MKNFFLKILSLVFPITCSSCGKDLPPLSKERICSGCRENFPKIEGLICSKCGCHLPEGGQFCIVCRKNKKEFAFDKMRSAFLYKDKIREMILKFKYYNRTFLSADLSEEMIKVYEKHPFFQQTDFIIAVPSNFFRRFKRGYNQALLLARAVSLKTGKPSLENILFRKKLTKAQFKLSKKQRAKNIDGSFYVKNKKAVEKKNILLIDDIATTAITASTCAKTLEKAGAKKVFVLTLARD